MNVTDMRHLRAVLDEHLERLQLPRAAEYGGEDDKRELIRNLRLAIDDLDQTLDDLAGARPVQYTGYRPS
jgi:low affinity Fe/Cu permease